jgi:hypothetical protein
LPKTAPQGEETDKKPDDEKKKDELPKKRVTKGEHIQISMKGEHTKVQRRFTKGEHIQISMQGELVSRKESQKVSISRSIVILPWGNISNCPWRLMRDQIIITNLFSGL